MKQKSLVNAIINLELILVCTAYRGYWLEAWSLKSLLYYTCSGIAGTRVYSNGPDSTCYISRDYQWEIHPAAYLLEH